MGIKLTYVKDERGKKIGFWNTYYSSTGKMWAKSFFKYRETYCQLRLKYNKDEILIVETIYIK